MTRTGKYKIGKYKYLANLKRVASMAMQIVN